MNTNFSQWYKIIKKIALAITLLLYSFASCALAQNQALETELETELEATEEESLDSKKLANCDNGKILSSALINDVPWKALYPIKIAGMRISPKGDGTPKGASKKRICSCEDDLGILVPGITASMYEPVKLIELVREPNCMMVFNGADMKFANSRMRGSIGVSAEGYRGEKAGFWHYHYYAFPVLQMLEMVLPNHCSDGPMSMDLLYLSELDPTWDDPELAFFTNMEAALFNNPISLSACLPDAAAAAVNHPIDSLFWCAGAWGSVYPFSGYKSGKSSMPTKTSLLATRAIATQHRRLLAKKTFGDEALCGPKIAPTIVKSQYKINMMYPIAERRSTHKIGSPSFLWGEWRNIPGKEDAIYLLWQYKECCLTFF